jgi:hypothetical protein
VLYVPPIAQREKESVMKQNSKTTAAEMEMNTGLCELCEDELGTVAGGEVGAVSSGLRGISDSQDACMASNVYANCLYG